MKKLIALFFTLSLMITATFVFAENAGMTENTNTAETEPAIVVPDSGHQAIDIDWTLPDTIEMTTEAAAIFNKAMEDLDGVNYEALGTLGEKEGTYCILCRASAVYPGAKPYYTLVYVNDAGIRNIWDIWMDKHADS